MKTKLILILSCIVAVSADMLFVWWAKSKSHDTLTFIAGMILINISAYLWAMSMRHGMQSGLAITFYALFTVTGCSALGILYFKETVSMLNMVGMIIGLIALCLLSL